MTGRGMAERGALYVFLGVGGGGGGFFKQIIQIATHTVWKSRDPYFAGWLANRQRSLSVTLHTWPTEVGGVGALKLQKSAK